MAREGCDHRVRAAALESLREESETVTYLDKRVKVLEEIEAELLLTSAQALNGGIIRILCAVQELLEIKTRELFEAKRKVVRAQAWVKFLEEKF